jgi:hypothetical protein
MGGLAFIRLVSSACFGRKSQILKWMRMKELAAWRHNDRRVLLRKPGDRS